MAVKNTLEGLDNRLDNAKEQIRELEDKLVEITQLKEQKEKRI